MRALERLAWIAPVAVAVLGTAALAQQEETRREITQVTGDLYRFQNNFHVSVFVVTPEGVIATDPIDAGAAAWLRDQIQDRFEQPIRYVIYSHDHADHISGCEVFEEAGAGIGALRGLTTDEHRGDVQPDRSAGRGN